MRWNTLASGSEDCIWRDHSVLWKPQQRWSSCERSGSRTAAESLLAWEPVLAWIITRFGGSCVLKASAVECKLIPSIDHQSTRYGHFDWHSNDIPINTTVNWHHTPTVGQQLTNSSQTCNGVSIDTSESVNTANYQYQFKCQPSINRDVNWDVDRVPRLSIDTQPWIPLVHMTWFATRCKLYISLYFFCKSISF